MDYHWCCSLNVRGSVKTWLAQQLDCSLIPVHTQAIGVHTCKQAQTSCVTFDLTCIAPVTHRASMLAGVLLLLGLMLVAYKLVCMTARSPALDRLPQPRGWPVVGHLFLMDNKRPHVTFSTWSGQCGGIFAICLLNERIVVLSSQEMLYQALLKKGRDFGGRSRNYYRLNVVSEGGRSLLASSMGPAWAYLRKTVHSQLKLYDSLAGKKNFEDITGHILNELVEAVSEMKGFAFDPRELIQNSIVNMMAVFLVGMKYDQNSRDFNILVTVDHLVCSTLAIGGSGALLDTFPWLRFLGNQIYRDLMELNKMRDTIYENIKAKIKEDFAKGEYSNGIAHVFFKDYYDQRNKKGVSDLDETLIKLAIMDLLIGGTTTTINSVATFVNLMVHYPQVQKTLRREIRSVVGTEHRPNLTDREHMPYTKAAILELLRYSTILPMAVPHTALVDSTIAGYTIPKGTLSVHESLGPASQ